MDTSDPSISFNDEGVCVYCTNFETTILPAWQSNIKCDSRLQQIAHTIKKRAGKADFDCIIGLSGGLDSSYAAHIAATKMGLKPLLFHVDAGWNTDRAVGNIEKLIDGLALDLYTEVINWDEIKRLQIAFLRAGIPDQDLVQDAAFFSALYKFARKNGVKSIITGSNFSTECCREPEEWGGYLGVDKTLFKDIWRKHGEGNLNTFPLIDIFEYKVLYQYVFRIKVYHPLNYIKFKKIDAEKELNKLYGWQPFQHKHHESRFTRFYEDYWLPRRFGFEKRRAHFSSLILTKQMTRTKALQRISKSEMDELFLSQEFSFVANKLGISVNDLENYFKIPKQTFAKFRNKRWIIQLGARILRALGLEKRYFR